jgi:hypothetical protein
MPGTLPGHSARSCRSSHGFSNSTTGSAGSAPADRGSISMSLLNLGSFLFCLIDAGLIPKLNVTLWCSTIKVIYLYLTSWLELTERTYSVLTA